MTPTEFDNLLTSTEQFQSDIIEKYAAWKKVKPDLDFQSFQSMMFLAKFVELETKINNLTQQLNESK